MRGCDTRQVPLFKKVDIVILSAMPEENEFIKHYFSNCQSEVVSIDEFTWSIYHYHHQSILIAYSGIGTVFAASMLTLIYCYFRPDYVLLSGTAGGIHLELKLCDVVVADKAFEAEIQSVFTSVKNTPFESCLLHPLKSQKIPAVFSSSEELLAIVSQLDIPGVHFRTGSVVSSNHFPAPKELFAQVKSYAPYAIDMETSAIYQIAWLLGIKVLAIRGMSNVLNDDGTDDHIAESDVFGSSIAAAKVLLAVLDVLCEKSQLANRLMFSQDISFLISLFHLQPHPEGGYFSQQFKSTHQMISENDNRYDGETRSAGTSIYYLLTEKDFSAWHQLKSDEIWHYYKGTTILVYMIDQLGSLTTYRLGDTTQDKKAVFQITIPAGIWFAAELLDKTGYSLVGCTVMPGFEFRDFELAQRESLCAQFPQYADLIIRLTRV